MSVAEKLEVLMGVGANSNEHLLKQKASDKYCRKCKSTYGVGANSNEHLLKQKTSNGHCRKSKSTYGGVSVRTKKVEVITRSLNWVESDNWEITWCGPCSHTCTPAIRINDFEAVSEVLQVVCRVHIKAARVWTWGQMFDHRF